MVEIFDTVLNANIPLRIYDRNRFSGRSSKPFPDKYLQYIRDSVTYEELGNIYRESEYVINVNTVNNSNTMFSRRIYEAMACGCIIITNESIGLRRQFGDRLWYINNKFDFGHKEYIRKHNIEQVFSFHTWKQRMEQLCSIINNNGIQPDNEIYMMK